MQGHSSVQLLGNITWGPEFRHTSVDPVCNFGMAVNRMYTTKDGREVDEPTFIDCTAWRRQAEIIAEHFRKGDRIFVSGRLRTEQWQDAEGNSRSKLTTVVQNFSFIEARRNPADDKEPTESVKKFLESKHGDEPQRGRQIAADSEIPF